MGNVRAAYNHGIINRDNFCQCDRISDIIIWMSTIKGYFKFLVLLSPFPHLTMLVASQGKPRNPQHCNRGGGGEGERSANFYLDLRRFFNVPNHVTVP